MNKHYLWGILLCSVAVLSWGGMFPIMGPALKIMDPFNFTLWRYGIVAIIFAILLLVKEGPKAFSPEKHFFKLWFLGTSAFAGFSLFRTKISWNFGCFDSFSYDGGTTTIGGSCRLVLSRHKTQEICRYFNVSSCCRSLFSCD